MRRKNGPRLRTTEARAEFKSQGGTQLRLRNEGPDGTISGTVLNAELQNGNSWSP